ncbi:hypothetical protein BDV36DRAFT_278914 [Aspergillus pseudocaelatus]|uniref:Amino acid/polyamine transporter I n=1 Tax=Aspergillus pseudocaelatus TaxID=1825620 RepID=A0ABQ6X5G9_9EURO|nr:hypothetical protein BDV36DRAFT_278914 [Aspergillus pseudocaelatus]
MIISWFTCVKIVGTTWLPSSGGPVQVGGFSLANSWFGISTALATGIKSGGPVQVVYGLIIITFVCGCIAASLAELSSAMPNAGGQYYWTGQLANPRYARFIIALSVEGLCIGCIQLTHPNLAAKSPSHQPSTFVFTEFINETGWSSDGIAFIVGLINSKWAFNGLDYAAHLAEEVLYPEKVVPIAIMATVAMGFVTAWPFSIAMMYSMNDFDSIAATVTGVPVLELFLQALDNKAGAARLCWSFARDNGLPGSRYLSQVHPTLLVPVWSHLASTLIVSILGCLYLGSYTAFNSMVTAAVVLLYASYSSPVICLLVKGRSSIRHGPFWLGVVGHCCNYLLLAWLLFSIVDRCIHSFPPSYPVTANNMNYVCVVYFVTLIIILAWWMLHARKNFTLH